MFGSWMMIYVKYVTVKYYHGNKLDENGNTCSVAANILMVVANIFINHIYSAHPMVVVIQILWNP